jgi:uncharacterized protein (TIGR03118 family)
MRYVFRLTALTGLIFLASTFARGDYAQTNLVSDLPSEGAKELDPNLVNPWGMSFSGTSPFWVSNQGSHTSTLYNALRTPITQALVVQIGTGPPGPTGQVNLNNTNSAATDFLIPSPSGTIKAAFLFVTLNGTLQGWNPGSNAGLNASETVQTVTNASFTGLTIASFNGANFLYAADATGRIIVFDNQFANVTSTTFAGKFVDPNPVAGFTPYNIQKLSDGFLYVTYAAAGTQGGYVDKYDTAGNFIARVATGAPLNGPWGLALAPAGFGQFNSDLLIGNLNDSKINAYNPTTFQFVGSITVQTGFTSPVGLWGLAFGNGASGDANTLYFTSGVNDQKDGLFGSIAAVPEPGSASLLVIGALALGGFWLRRGLA